MQSHTPSTIVLHLSNELDDTTGSLDLRLSGLGDEAGLDDEGLVDAALAEELELAGVDKVNDGDGASGGLNLRLGKRNKLWRSEKNHLLCSCGILLLTLSMLMVGRKVWFFNMWK
jgi:hypothetical protein